MGSYPNPFLPFIIVEIKNNKINHILNFYKVEDSEFKKIF